MLLFIKKIKIYILFFYHIKNKILILTTVKPLFNFLFDRKRKRYFLELERLQLPETRNKASNSGRRIWLACKLLWKTNCK